MWISILMPKIFLMKHLPSVRPKLVPKLKMLNLVNIALWIKLKNAWNLLKFGTFDFSNMPISILMPKIIFMKHLPSVRPKLVPKLKMLNLVNIALWIKMKNAWNLLKFGTFDFSNMPISILMSKIIFLKYLTIIRPKLVSKPKCSKCGDI